jgi:tight adherence protein B
MSALLLPAGLLAALTALALAGGPPSRRPAAARSTAAGTGPVRRHLDAAVEHATRHRRRRQRDAQLPDALDRIAAGLRAGQGMGPTIVSVAAAVPAPLGLELCALALRLGRGERIAEALRGWAEAPASSEPVRLAAATLQLGVGAGGSVARAVDGVAATLRERQELAAEVRALATQARSSAGVLAVAPLGFTALTAMVEPAVLRFLLTTPAGLLCLLLGLGLQGLGAWWMARIVREAT